MLSSHKYCVQAQTARLIALIVHSDNVAIKVVKSGMMWHIRAIESRGTDLGTEQVIHMWAL